jgi:mono/diheme cytochrome c family protein
MQDGGVKVIALAFVASIGLSLVALIGVGCLLGANACPFTKSGAVATNDPGEVWLMNCALCHGIEGDGSPQNPRAPSLVREPSASLSLAELIRKIGRGSPGLMPRFKGKLSEGQIDAVARYVIELREAS